MNMRKSWATVVAAFAAVGIGHLHAGDTGPQPPAWTCSFRADGYYRSDNGWYLGSYRNNLCRSGFYGGWSAGAGLLRAGLGLGAAGMDGERFLPVLRPTVAVSLSERDSVRAILLPKADPTGHPILHVTLEHTL